MRPKCLEMEAQLETKMEQLKAELKLELTAATAPPLEAVSAELLAGLQASPGRVCH